MMMSSASPSISYAQASHILNKGVLQSRDPPSKRQKRESETDKTRIIREIQQLEGEIAGLERQCEREREKRGEIVEEKEMEDDLDEDDDVEALEAMLKEMDDGALASLLTQNVSLSSLQALLPHLSEEKMAIPPPAKSAGIEGTGSGLQMDADSKVLDQLDGGRLTEDNIKSALHDRLQRGNELLEYLARFAAIDFYHMKSTQPSILKEDDSKLLRTITMNGRLSEGLGEIEILVDVVESMVEGVGQGPQIVKLDVDVGNELYRALGEDHLRDLVDEMNLPGLLLSVRTLLPMARTRKRLFQAIIKAFPNLSKPTKEMKSVFESEEGGLLDILVDPLAMETLSLQNKKGARLDIAFAIRFNQWGHARPEVSVKPSLSDSVRLSAMATEVLEQLPANFDHLCAHLSSPFDVSTALVTTIQAFFGLPA